jgi:hypothetical protein
LEKILKYIKEETEKNESLGIPFSVRALSLGGWFFSEG